MAKAKNESKAGKSPALDIKEEVKDEVEAKPEVKVTAEAPKEETPKVVEEVKEAVKEEAEAPKEVEAEPKLKGKPECGNCSAKFGNATCLSCVIYRRMKK